MAFVQAKSSFAGIVSTTTLTFPSAVNAGDLLVTGIRRGGVGNTYLSVSDNVNGTNWTLLTNQSEPSGGNSLYIAYFPGTAAASAGSMVVTATFSGAASVNWGALEYSSVAKSTPVDQHASGSSGGGFTQQSGIVTTTSPSEIAVGFIILSGNVSTNIVTDAPGWSSRVNVGPSPIQHYIDISDYALTTTSTVSQTWTLSSSDSCATAIVSFRNAVAGLPPFHTRVV